MEVGYKVRIWKSEKFVGKTATTYAVRWTVNGAQKKRRFPTKALAEAFRAELVAQQRRGVAFDVSTGLPVTAHSEKAAQTTWYQFACTYVEMKWPGISEAPQGNCRGPDHSDGRAAHGEAVRRGGQGTAVSAAQLGAQPQAGRGRPAG